VTPRLGCSYLFRDSERRDSWKAYSVERLCKLRCLDGLIATNEYILLFYQTSYRKLWLVVVTGEIVANKNR
jgi:hypothetical protein